MKAILDGIRVLDFGRYIAGPFCGALLGDLGAEVIRIERLGGGEDRFVLPVTDDGVGAMFLQCNRNKRGMTLNPTKPEGREVAHKLVAGADVVIANLPPQTLKTMGLDYDTLKAIKPDIILTTVNAFASGGPWSSKVGFDGLAQSMSGNLYMSGPPDTPTRAFAPYVDYGTASLTAMSTVAALFHRERTGEGQFLEGALLKTALTMMNSPIMEQHHSAIDRVATFNRSPMAGPADVFATTDGWIMCMAIGQYQFDRWAKLVGADDLLEDERFKDDIGRGDHGEIISARMRDWCAERSTEMVLAALEDAKVPAGPVYSPQQVLDDPHVDAIGFFEQVKYPTADSASPVSGFPVHLSETPGTVRSPAPQLGQHTDEILQELGYDNAAIAALREKRCV